VCAGSTPAPWHRRRHVEHAGCRCVCDGHRCVCSSTAPWRKACLWSEQGAGECVFHMERAGCSREAKGAVQGAPRCQGASRRVCVFHVERAGCKGCVSVQACVCVWSVCSTGGQGRHAGRTSVPGSVQACVRVPRGAGQPEAAPQLGG
jgi:hypothetical protein